MKKPDTFLHKQWKRMAVLLYKGKMPKFVRKELGAVPKERAMMLYDVKKPKGYDGV